MFIGSVFGFIFLISFRSLLYQSLAFDLIQIFLGKICYRVWPNLEYLLMYVVGPDMRYLLDLLW